MNAVRSSDGAAYSRHFEALENSRSNVLGISTAVGSAGGREENPTYKQVSAGETSHRESIEVTYDPTKVAYAALLDVFCRNINPIQTDGQFHDIGDQYTSAIFYTGDKQKKATEESKQALAQSGKFQKPIATAILSAASSGREK